MTSMKQKMMIVINDLLKICSGNKNVPAGATGGETSPMLLVKALHRMIEKRD